MPIDPDQTNIILDPLGACVPLVAPLPSPLGGDANDVAWEGGDSPSGELGGELADDVPPSGRRRLRDRVS